MSECTASDGLFIQFFRFIRGLRGTPDGRYNIGALRRKSWFLHRDQPFPTWSTVPHTLMGPGTIDDLRGRGIGPVNPPHHLAVRHQLIIFLASFIIGFIIEFIVLFISDHSLPSPSPSDHLNVLFCERSRKRSRSPVASVRSPETATDLEDCSEDRFEPYVPREVGLGVDLEDESFEPSRSRGANLEMDDECCEERQGIEIDPGIDARVVVEAADREESETGMRGLVKRFHDHTEAISVHRVHIIEEAQREQGHRIVGAEPAVTVLTERVAELKRDNRRLRGTMSVESQRVDRLQRGMTRMQIEPEEILTVSIL
ncbi:hypothetical protein Tco_0904029 [Tanacetum coccineum]